MVGLELLTGLRAPDCRVATEQAGSAAAPGLVDLLRAATDPDPDRRPPDATAFRRRLAALGVPPVADRDDPDAPAVFEQLSTSARAEPTAEPGPQAFSERPARRWVPRTAGAEAALPWVLLAVALACAVAAVWVLRG
jgi:hypothetical protein